MVEVLTLFFMLVCAHALADFGLQNEFIAKNKNTYILEEKNSWIIILTTHCLIHTSFVLVITQSIIAALFE